ncbi:MAG TPA: DUF4942 domain-containing protein [Prosthecobacter sp.]
MPFLRSKTSGVKFYDADGTRAALIAVSTLPALNDALAGLPVRCETCESIRPARQMHPVETGLQCHACRMPSTRELVGQVAGTPDDHEFYPTTAEIIAALCADLHAFAGSHGGEFATVLDIGAGSGKVLCALRDCEALRITSLHAIEKSVPLLRAMPPEVRIIGTDFAQQSLLTKAVDITFSNPPYSQFEEWSTRIIRESTSGVVYLVIPQRWKASQPIAAALEYANRVAHVVGSYDFENAEDRAARARVDLVRIAAPDAAEFEEREGESWMHRRDRWRSWDRFTRRRDERPDTFRLQFNAQFKELLQSFEDLRKPASDEEGTGAAPSRDKFAQLVPGADYAAALVAMYQADLAHVERNYAAAAQLDAALLREFDINPAKICDCLRQRLAGLRNAYWHELFGKLDKITERLTAKTRRGLLDQLHQHVHIDFTLANIEAVVIWVLKNANHCFGSQLVEVFERMVEKCNVVAYKSNQRTFEQDGWRYNSQRDKWSHYALDYRIVCQYIGGITGATWRGTNNLADEAHAFLEDLRTIAHNLGFQRGEHDATSQQIRWTRGTSETFDCITPKGGRQTLLTVRAYENGNLHLKLNKQFILALNVEHGRLKGWLKSGQHAAEELKDPAAAVHFNTNLALPPSYNPLQLAA